MRIIVHNIESHWYNYMSPAFPSKPPAELLPDEKLRGLSQADENPQRGGYCKPETLLEFVHPELKQGTCYRRKIRTTQAQLRARRPCDPADVSMNPKLQPQRYLVIT